MVGTGLGGLASYAPMERQLKEKALRHIKNKGVRAALLALGVLGGAVSGGATGAGIGYLASPKPTFGEKIRTHLPTVLQRQYSPGGPLATTSRDVASALQRFNT